MIARFEASVLADPEGGQVPVQQWQGQVLVLNYWASWCAPCREEMPIFSHLSRQWAPAQVQFLGLALDTDDRVRDFAARDPVRYPLLMANPESLDLAKAAGNPALALPFTVILSADGRIHAHHLGVLGAAELERLLVSALAAGR